mgnify:CR=1 FL=1
MGELKTYVTYMGFSGKRFACSTVLVLSLVSCATTVSDVTTIMATGETYTVAQGGVHAVAVSVGTLKLTNPVITKTGDAVASGNNAAVYAFGKGMIILQGGSVSTDAEASGALSCSGGASIQISNTSITTKQGLSQGLISVNGGTITARNVSVTTEGKESVVFAIGDGGGRLTVNDCSCAAKGEASALLSSVGTLTANHIAGSSASGEIAVLDGGVVTINNSHLASGASSCGFLFRKGGTLTAFGGSFLLTSFATPLASIPSFQTGTITLDGVKMTVPSGVILQVSSGAKGDINLCGGLSYTGDIVLDDNSSATMKIAVGTTWNGAFDSACLGKDTDLTLNGGVWNLTNDSHVGRLTVKNGANVHTNGHRLSLVTLMNDGGSIDGM